MKIQAKVLYTSVVALETLMSSKLPIQTAYDISLIMDEVVKVHGIIEDAREDIIKRFGTYDIATQAYNIDENDSVTIDKASLEFEAYLQTELEVNIEKIDVKVFNDISITINDIKLLGWLFTK